MDIVIRPIMLQDVEEINEFRRMKGVMENTLSMSSERVSATKKKFADDFNSCDHIFVAEIREDEENRVVAVAGQIGRASCRERVTAPV